MEVNSDWMLIPFLLLLSFCLPCSNPMSSSHSDSQDLKKVIKDVNPPPTELKLKDPQPFKRQQFPPEQIPMQKPDGPVGMEVHLEGKDLSKGRHKSK